MVYINHSTLFNSRANFIGNDTGIGEGNIFLSPSRFFGWSTNQTDIRQVNQRKTD